MKNLFKLYREWRDRKFVERINRVYFKKDEKSNLYLEGTLHVSKDVILHDSIATNIDSMKEYVSKKPKTMKKATLVIKGDLISLGRIAPAREGGGNLVGNVSEKTLESIDISTATVIEGTIQVDNFLYNGFVVVTGQTWAKK